MNYIWSGETKLHTFPHLNDDIKTDVLVIGGGICGLLCGYMLSQQGIDCIIVEANKIGGGTTAGTTAKITFQHGLIYNDIEKRYGMEKAQMYLAANIEAFDKYKLLCENIDCDYTTSDSYVYSLSSRQKIEDEILTLEKLGYDPYFTKELEIPLTVEGAVQFKNQAHFHPLKFISYISKNLRIFENTPVVSWNGTHFCTSAGKIKAEQAIIATHFPFLNKHGGYPLKIYQHRSYVTALDKAQKIKHMYVDASGNGLSFRPYKDKILLGGGGHRTGKNSGSYRVIDHFADIHYPNASKTARWATQDCMTLDSIPYIGQYSKTLPNIYVATGFNKWGMTSSMVSAIMLTEIIRGRTPDYAEVFSPSRSILHPQLFTNSFESALNFLRLTGPRCPHLGCSLRWNRYEHSWDCPCHGSRFSSDGELIDGPATGDINIK